MIVCQCHSTDWLISSGHPVSSVSETDCHDVTQILLEVDISYIYFRDTTFVLCIRIVLWKRADGIKNDSKQS